MKYFWLLSFFLFLSCDNEKPTLDQYKWLEGNWQSADATSSESWNQISKQSFNGIGYAHKDTATSIAEYLRLYKAENKWTLEAKVIGQNRGRTITFIESSDSSDEVLSLENLKHDYPKRITYSKRHKDTISVALNTKLPNSSNYELIRVEEIQNLNFIE